MCKAQYLSGAERGSGMTIAMAVKRSKMRLRAMGPRIQGFNRAYSISRFYFSKRWKDTKGMGSRMW